jgi:nitrogen fixation protein FixH
VPGAARLVIVDGGGHPVNLGDVKVLINRPVGGHEDQNLTLKQNPDGTYEAPVTLPNGAWDATVSAPHTPLGPFELVRRFFVGDDK